MVEGGFNQLFVSQLTPLSCGAHEQQSPEMLILGWTASGLLFVAALGLLPYYLWLAGAALCSSLLLAVLFAVQTHRFADSSLLCHEVTITERTVTLQTFYLGNRRQREQSLILSDVRSARIHDGLLELRTVNQRLQIPLWSFGANARFMVDILESRGLSPVGKESMPLDRTAA